MSNRMTGKDVFLARAMGYYHHRAVLSPETLITDTHLPRKLLVSRLSRFVENGWAEQGNTNGQPSGQYRLTALGRRCLRNRVRATEGG